MEADPVEVSPGSSTTSTNWARRAAAIEQSAETRSAPPHPDRPGRRSQGSRSRRSRRAVARPWRQKELWNTGISLESDEPRMEVPMSSTRIYLARENTVNELLEQACGPTGATLLIPELQRP